MGVTPRRLVEYLELYAARFNLKPAFNAAVRAVRRENTRWRVEAGAKSYAAPIIVVATGWADFPYWPTWPGLEAFWGVVAHSSAHRNPGHYAGKRVLVVGFGNSGGEIALDLAESSIDVTLAVRGPVRILPRELLGLPILTWAIAQRHLPARLADVLNAPAIRLAVGSIEPRHEALGEGSAPDGRRGRPHSAARRWVGCQDPSGRDQSARGHRPGHAGWRRVFGDGPEPFDAIILATGFRPNMRVLLPDATSVSTARGSRRFPPR